MKLITRDTDYALRAICFIAKQKEKIVSVSDLVEGLKLPKPFLRKLLQILNKKRILKSYKGQGGGFLLVEPAGKIFLVDLIEAFQGPLELNECFLKKMRCPQMKTCALREKIKRIEKYVFNQLSSITIASLLR
ncbi:MAG: Rrf2 family transcriptional regulator [Candidatus Omnitrophica bacterium]|nr:Rrf2 family transcriptional regulator [Candidatus Omnitrophota bacterium]